MPDSGRVLVDCRPVALRRAVRNLMENAAAHGVRATARVADGGGRVRVVIEDEEPGIPESDLAARASALPSPGPSSAATAGTSRWRTAPKAD